MLLTRTLKQQKKRPDNGNCSPTERFPKDAAGGANFRTGTEKKKGACVTYVSPKASRPEFRLTRDRDVRARELSYKAAAASLFRCSNGAEENAP